MRDQLYHGLIVGLHRTRFHNLKVSEIEVSGLVSQEEKDLVYGEWGFKKGVSTKAAYFGDKDD